MGAIEVGSICIKTAGRESGKKCIVVEMVDKNFVLITGPKDVTGVKRRRINIKHIEPMDEKLNIKKGASDEEITGLMSKK